MHSSTSLDRAHHRISELETLAACHEARLILQARRVDSLADLNRKLERTLSELKEKFYAKHEVPHNPALRVVTRADSIPSAVIPELWGDDESCRENHDDLIFSSDSICDALRFQET